MIWAKTTNQPHPTTAVIPRDSAPCPTTWVTGIGLVSIVGDQPFALLGAIGTMLSGAKPDPVLSLPVPGQDMEQSAMTAALAELEGIGHPAERMEVLATEALLKAFQSAAGNAFGAKTLVLTLLPAQSSPRGAVINRDSFMAGLKSQLPELVQAQFRFAETSSGPVAQLIEVCRELAENTWETVVFGGVDSLVDPVTCTELALAGRLMTAGGFEGLVPGEGAAYLVLQAAKMPSGKSQPMTLAQIQAAAQAPEPHADMADSKPMTGLAAAIQQTLAQAGLQPENLGGVVLPLGAETCGTLEWHQAHQKVWPARKNENSAAETQTETREELLPHLTLGELGAATLPFALALACARFEFEHPPLETILACEAGDDKHRGAILLQAPQKA
jgi:3-oxoacyl-[acyl-carrier-protein] synthase-1